MKFFNGELRRMAHETLVTAAEGGIGYWCLLYKYDWHDTANGDVRVKPLAGWEEEKVEGWEMATMGPVAFTVSAGDVLRTMRRMARGTVGTVAVPKHWQKAAALWLLDPEQSDIDADAADVIVQYAALGDIVYG